MQQKILKWSLLCAIVFLIIDTIVSGIPNLLIHLLNYEMGGMSLCETGRVFGYIIPLINDIFQIFMMVVGGTFIYMNRKRILPMVGGGLIVFQGLIAMLVNLIYHVSLFTSSGYFYMGYVYLIDSLILSFILFMAFVILSFHYKDKIMGIITAVYAVVEFNMIVILLINQLSSFIYTPWGFVILGMQGLLVLIAEVTFLYLWFRKIKQTPIE